MRKAHVGLLFTLAAVTALVVAACSDGTSSVPTNIPAADAALVDAPESDGGLPPQPDAEIITLPKCDVAKPFGAPQHLPELPATATSPSLTDDELTMIYGDNSGKDTGVVTLFEAKRANFKAPFQKGVEISALHVNGYREDSPRILGDGKGLLFASNRPGGTGTSIISGFYFAVRTSTTATFQPPGLLDIPSISGAGTEFKKSTPFLTRDGSELWFERSASNPIQQAIWSAAVSATGDIGTPVERLVDGSGSAFAPVLSADGLSLYYTINDGAASGLNVWKATRAAKNAPFSDTAKVVELSSAGDDLLWHITSDGCRAYLQSTRGPTGIFVASRPL